MWRGDVVYGITTRTWKTNVRELEQGRGCEIKSKAAERRIETHKSILAMLDLYISQEERAKTKGKGYARMIRIEVLFKIQFMRIQIYQ